MPSSAEPIRPSAGLKPFQRAVVLGAGTMGAAIAAHLANAGLQVLLLDLAPQGLSPDEAAAGKTLADPEVRDRIPRLGLQRAIAARPASFFTRDTADRVRIGNFEDNLDEVGRADWVIEAVVEDLEVKRRLLGRVQAALDDHAVVSSNTSGIPIAAIAQNLSPEFRRRFLGTHFFNPPRYLPLLETIPLPDTDPAVLAAVEEFGGRRLGKTVVRANDTPNFIANRLGSVAGAFVLDFALERGYSVEEVDAITGPALGRPKTATFRLLDWVGLDVASTVRRNLARALPQDEAAPYLTSPRAESLVQTMVERGWLGNKAEAGFYRRVVQDGRQEFWALDLTTLEHRPPAKPEIESLARAREVSDLAERIRLFLAAEDRAGDLVRAILFHGMAYASRRIPEIADTPDTIDRAVRAGFAHELGPFELWDRLGPEETSRAMAAAGFASAEWVQEMLATSRSTFYEMAPGGRRSVYRPGDRKAAPLVASPLEVSLARLRAEGGEIVSNPGAALLDLGEGVACLEIRSKGNTLDEDVLQMLETALGRTEREFAGLIVGTDSEDFSLGANLFMVAAGAQSGLWDQLDRGVRALQSLALRLRYSPRPVVMALAGRTLGGGAELAMAGSRIVASAESYVGLVEVAAGLIPAGGGCKELLRRVVNPAMRTEGAGPLPFLQQVFETIGQARVGTSAEESRALGFLAPADRVVMNRLHLLGEAKREVLHLAPGYRPPAPEKIYAAGRDGLAALRVGVFMAREARAITEFEAALGNKLAEVLTGGNLSRPAWVDEQYILDRERETFLSLCGEEKAQQRMWHLLQTRKPLRN